MTTVGISRRSWRRWRAAGAGALVGAVGGIVLAPELVAADPAGPTDYETEVVAITPPTPGLDARAIGGDSFFEVTVDPAVIAVDVVVLGYRGEPYLRFRADGTIEENRLAPTTYLNDDRYGQGEAPADADPEAAPEWRTVGHGRRWAWHDHRTHWMNSFHPLGSHPGDQILDAVVPLLVGDRPVDIEVISTWRPAPSSLPALLGAAAGVLLAGLAIVAGRTRARFASRAPATVVALLGVAALAVGLWQTWSVPSETGPPITGWALPATALAVAAIAAAAPLSAFTRAGLVLVGAVQLVLWGWGRRSGLERAILPTNAPFWLDRAVTAAVAGAFVLGLLALWQLGRMLAPGRTPPAQTAPQSSLM